MNNKYINISDIASLIGQSNYDVVTPFERLLKKCDSYNKILNEINDNKNEQELEIEKVKEEVVQIKKEYEDKKITKEEFVKKIETTSKQETKINNNIRNIENKVDSITLNNKEKLTKIIGEETLKKLDDNTISNESKQKILQNRLKEEKIEDKNILKQGVSLINTNYGTRLEDTAIKMFEKKFKVILDTSQKYNSKKIYTRNYNWYIGGKVDGLYIDTMSSKKSYIVEVKNRVRSFFNTLRDYEKTQIHLYMEILSIPRAKLVEKYESKLRITDIYKDTKYTEEILLKIQKFIDLFEEFIKNNEIQKEFIMKELFDKRNFIQVNFFNKLEESESEGGCEDEECLI